jgi:hypothetical protein
MLERAWRLPASPGAPMPPAGPGLLRSLGLAGAVAAGALFNSSGGELALLQLQGRVPLDIGLGQWQRAGAALERWNPHWRLPSSSTPEQVGQLVRRAAEIEEQRSGRQLTPQQFRRAMGELVRALQASPGPQAAVPAATTPAAAPRSPAPPPSARPQPEALVAQALARLREALRTHQAAPTARTRGALNDELAHTASLHRQHGARWPAETAARYGELATRARSALAQPLHAARAGQAVQQLGQAIRAFNAQPADPARRGALNDALALARSLHANRHEWTPATRRNFDALAPQAVRALYGPAPKAPKAAPAGLPQLGSPPNPALPARPGLPAQRSETARTRGTGARTGEGAAELEQRSRSRQAQALETARRQVYEQRRTLLPGGSLEALARGVHTDLGGAAALGVSADEFVARVQQPGPIQGADAAGRFRSGPAGSGSGSGSSTGPAAWDLRSMPSTLDPNDWNGYFGPQRVVEVVREFATRYRLDPDNVATHHDALAHLLQTRVERPDDEELSDWQFTLIVDRVVWELANGSTLEDARASAIAEFDEHQLQGPGRSAFLVDYILEQIQANADLNRMSVPEFIEKLTHSETADGLLLKRPTHHPLEVGPPKFDTRELVAFLRSSRDRDVVRLGRFEMTFRIPLIAPIDANRCLILTSVTADQPASGQYAQALRALALIARHEGFGALVVERADPLQPIEDPRLGRIDKERIGRFYEAQGYGRVPGPNGNGSYFIRFDPP